MFREFVTLQDAIVSITAVECSMLVRTYVEYIVLAMHVYSSIGNFL